MCVHAKANTKKLADKQWKERMQRVCERGIKQISMIDIVSMQESKQMSKKGKQVRKQTKDGVCKRQM